MLTGMVKFFNETKGFGFIKEDGSEKEYFVHITGVKDKIKQNDKVSFEVKEAKKVQTLSTLLNYNNQACHTICSIFWHF